ncbi:MAG: hypothetical protein ACYC64_11370 [Armatimonadota bacterium]
MLNKTTGLARLGVYLALAALVCSGVASAGVRTYTTNGLTVTHDTADEGMYFDSQPNELAYNVQIMRADNDTYYTIFHSEPNKPAKKHYPGDSIKTGIQTGDFTYSMPDIGFRLYGHPTDSQSIMYSPEDYGTNGWGGAGNPMLVKGRSGDKYYYAFFIAVTDDDHDRDINEADFRHYLCQARSLDMLNWELRTEIDGVSAWKPFNSTVPMEWRRARTIQDVDGNTIRGLRATAMSGTQGLIGSICYCNDKYYYFYTDVDADGNTGLYVRTCADLTRENAWSAAQKVADKLMLGMIVRVAKARGLNRWAVLYNGYKAAKVQDLMLQYTSNMNVVGPGGISDIKFYNEFVFLEGYNYGISDKYLGLASGTDCFAQHYFMTDEYGNLAVPNQECQDYTRGGMVTWSAFTSSIYGDNVYRASWNVSQ